MSLAYQSPRHTHESKAEAWQAMSDKTALDLIARGGLSCKRAKVYIDSNTITTKQILKSLDFTAMGKGAEVLKKYYSILDFNSL